ncbi:MAG: hypothetical protein ABJP66_07370 [Hyphomicrobiales bacterium]
MARFNKKTDEALICMIGFVFGAVVATSLTGSLGTIFSEPLQIEQLFEHAESTSRLIAPAKPLLTYDVEVYE